MRWPTAMRCALVVVTTFCAGRPHVAAMTGEPALRWMSPDGSFVLRIRAPLGEASGGMPVTAYLESGSGAPVWCTTMPMPSVAFVSPAGHVVALRQRSAGRIGRRREEGIRFYRGADGGMVRFISAFFFPAVYARGVRWWFEEGGTGWSPDGRTFRLRLPNGFTLAFTAGSGRLAAVAWDLGTNPMRTIASWFGTPGLRASVLTLVAGNAAFLLCVGAGALARRWRGVATDGWCDIRQYPYLVLFSGAVFVVMFLYGNLRWVFLVLA